MFDYLFKLQLGRFGFPEFVIGALDILPVPSLTGEAGASLGHLAVRAWSEKNTLRTMNSDSHVFVRPALLPLRGRATRGNNAAAWAARVRTSEEIVAAIQAEIDDLAFRLYGLDEADRAALTFTTETSGNTESEAGKEEEQEATSVDTVALVADLLDYTFGTAFGRWDIRYSTGERSWRRSFQTHLHRCRSARPGCSKTPTVCRFRPK